MILYLLALAMIAQDAAPSVQAPAMPVSTPIPKVQTVSSTNFMFLQSRVRADGDTAHIAGRVCRRANRSVISPTRVEIDHLSATGDVIDTGYAYLPRLSQREDQRCGGFSAKLKTPPQPGDVVWLCLPQSHGPCRAS